MIPNFNYDPKKSYFELIVPTKDTVCYSWLLKANIKMDNHVFFTGFTGTGKTILVESVLSELM